MMIAANLRRFGVDTELPPLTVESAEKNNTPAFSISNMTVRAKVIDVHDGDSLTAAFDTLGLGIYSHKIRLLGVDAPELNVDVEKKCAIISRDWLAGLVEGKIVQLQIYRPDKYGRLLAKVIYGGYIVNTQALAECYVRPYDGGTRRPWTPVELSRIPGANMQIESYAPLDSRLQMREYLYNRCAVS